LRAFTGYIGIELGNIDGHGALLKSFISGVSMLLSSNLIC
jgi:hypothetical protein